MFTMTQAAHEKLTQHAFDPAVPLRISLSPRGCGGPRVYVVPDTPLPSDTVFSCNGYTLFMNSELYAFLETIELDLAYSDFAVYTKNDYTVPGCGQCPAAATNGGECSLSKGSTSCYG